MSHSRMMIVILQRTLLLLILLVGLHSGSGPAAANWGSFIRDAEIETILRSWTRPLAEAANLNPESLHIHIVNNPDINAFVAGGQRIILTTGLLIRAGRADAVIGVIAHELGHIAGGHLARFGDARGKAESQAMIGVLAGMVVGILGRPDAALAVSAKAQDIANRSLATYTRSQERSADRVAVDLLKSTGTSTQGLLKLLQELERNELRLHVASDGYIRTHPANRERIEFVRRHAVSEASKRTHASRAEEYDRIVAKLSGFVNPPARTFREYPADNLSLKGRYARAIAYHREARLAEAVREIDDLIERFPEDPYFWELKGQMLFEHGRLREALPAYEKAAALLPEEPLILVGLANVQIALGIPDLYDKALANLDKAKRTDPHLSMARRLAAVAYNRTKRNGMAALEQAEYEELILRPARARAQAKKAFHLLPEGSPGHQRAQDILHKLDQSQRR